MRDVPGHDDEVERSVAHHLVGEVHPVFGPRVANLWDRLRYRSQVPRSFDHAASYSGWLWPPIGPGRARLCRPLELCALLANSCLERAEGRPWLYSQLVEEPISHERAGAQGFGVPTAPVQRQDPLTPQSFAEGIGDHQRIQLARNGPMATAREVGIDPILDRTQASFAESGRLRFQAYAPLYICKRLAAPQAERVAKRGRRLGRVARRGVTSRLLDEHDELDVRRRSAQWRADTLATPGCNGAAVAALNNFRTAATRTWSTRRARSAARVGQSSSISRSAPTTRPRLITKRASSARSFGAGGVTSTPLITASSGPSTRTATSTAVDPRYPPAGHEWPLEKR